jgi:hypothetical protein
MRAWLNVRPPSRERLKISVGPKLQARYTASICLPASQDGITYRAGRMVPVSTMKERHL